MQGVRDPFGMPPAERDTARSSRCRATTACAPTWRAVGAAVRAWLGDGLADLIERDDARTSAGSARPASVDRSEQRGTGARSDARVNSVDARSSVTARRGEQPVDPPRRGCRCTRSENHAVAAGEIGVGDEQRVHVGLVPQRRPGGRGRYAGNLRRRDVGTKLMDDDRDVRDPLAQRRLARQVSRSWPLPHAVSARTAASTATRTVC